MTKKKISMINDQVQWDSYALQGGFTGNTTGTISTNEDQENGDLFDAALLFLDQYDDLDSHSSSSLSHSHSNSDSSTPGSSPSPNHSDHSSYDFKAMPLLMAAHSDYKFQASTPAVIEDDAIPSLHVQLKLPPLPPRIHLDVPLSSSSPVADAGTGHSFVRLLASPLPTTTALAVNKRRGLLQHGPPRRVNKRREEIERLKIQVTELQSRLTSLSDRSVSPLREATLLTNEVQLAVGGSAWQTLAVNQRGQRERAEAENHKLRQMIHEHQRLAKTLRRLLTRQASTKAWDRFQPAPSPSLRSPQAIQLLDDDPTVFDTLLASLFPMYLQTDAMLCDPKLSTLTNTYRDSSTELQGGENLVVHYLDARVVPFDLHATGSAMWRHYTSPLHVKAAEWHQVNENTMRAQFTAYTEMGNFKGLAQGKMVIRKIDEPNRVVILRSAVFHCLDEARKAKNPFVALSMKHFLWTTIEKPRHPGFASRKDAMAQIQVRGISMPRLETTLVDGVSRTPAPATVVDDDERDRELAELADTCLSISAFHADKTQEEVDNLLLRGNV